jgi:hypothetical protein
MALPLMLHDDFDLHLMFPNSQYCHRKYMGKMILSDERDPDWDFSSFGLAQI